MNPSDPQPDLLQPRDSGVSLRNFEALQDRYESLRVLFVITIVALILFSLGVNLFIAKQMRMVRTQLEEQRPLVQKLSIDFQKTTEPLLKNFTAQLQTFAATHRDFQPILEKYRPGLASYFSARVLPPSAPALAPAAAPPARQK